MTGKRDFQTIYLKQIMFQKLLTKKTNLPDDEVEDFMYHIASLTEEVGEVLKEDKRWKTHRNTVYDKEKKLEEMADVMITVMNLYIFSGFTVEEILDSVNNKIQKNFKRNTERGAEWESI